jgi:hypothetical protein
MVEPIRWWRRPASPQRIQIDDGIADSVFNQEAVQSFARCGLSGTNLPLRNTL